MSSAVVVGDNDVKSVHTFGRIATDAKMGRDWLLRICADLTDDRKKEMDAAWLTMCKEAKTILTIEQVCAVAVSSLCKLDAPHGYVAALIEFLQPTWSNQTLSTGVRFHVMHMYAKMNEAAFVKKASSSSSSTALNASASSNATKATKSKRAIKNKKRAKGRISGGDLAQANQPPVGENAETCEIQSVDD